MVLSLLTNINRNNTIFIKSINLFPIQTQKILANLIMNGYHHTEHDSHVLSCNIHVICSVNTDSHIDMQNYFTPHFNKTNKSLQPQKLH